MNKAARNAARMLALLALVVSGCNGGTATIPVTGANFSPSTTASLILGGASINAASIDFRSASQLYATFDERVFRFHDTLM